MCLGTKILPVLIFSWFCIGLRLQLFFHLHKLLQKQATTTLTSRWSRTKDSTSLTNSRAILVSSLLSPLNLAVFSYSSLKSWMRLSWVYPNASIFLYNKESTLFQPWFYRDQSPDRLPSDNCLPKAHLEQEVFESSSQCPFFPHTSPLCSAT